MKEKTVYWLAVTGALIFVFWPGKFAFSVEEYRIGFGDTLNISVWENPQLNAEVVVRPDGMISFHLIDDILVLGKTPVELKAYLTVKLKELIKEPIVTVMVSSFHSSKVYIQGEVGTPGSYAFTPKTRLAEIVAVAGGIKIGTADLLKAFIIRGEKKLTVNFYKLFREGDISQNILLKKGDIIFVPDNFNNRITVLGSVGTPGIVTYRRGMTVLDAVLSAGGFTPRAAQDETLVIRKVDGQEKKINVDMKAVIKNGEMENNLLLLPADKILVPELWF